MVVIISVEPKSGSSYCICDSLKEDHHAIFLGDNSNKKYTHRLVEAIENCSRGSSRKGGKGREIVLNGYNPHSRGCLQILMAPIRHQISLRNVLECMDPYLDCRVHLFILPFLPFCSVDISKEILRKQKRERERGRYTSSIAKSFNCYCCI